MDDTAKTCIVCGYWNIDITFIIGLNLVERVYLIVCIGAFKCSSLKKASKYTNVAMFVSYFGFVMFYLHRLKLSYIIFVQNYYFEAREVRTRFYLPWQDIFIVAHPTEPRNVTRPMVRYSVLPYSRHLTYISFAKCSINPLWWRSSCLSDCSADLYLICSHLWVQFQRNMT